MPPEGIMPTLPGLPTWWGSRRFRSLRTEAFEANSIALGAEPA